MKKFLVCLIALMLVFSSKTVVYATDTIDVQGYDVQVDSDKDSIEYVEYETYLEEGAASADVYAVVSSKFKVTIPKTIVLKGSSEASATYQIDVDGDIAGDEYVLVQPDSSFILNTPNKASVSANVVQEKVKFRTAKYTITNSDETIFIDDTAFLPETTGTVSATLTAGMWKGTFNFKIELVQEVKP